MHLSRQLVSSMADQVAMHKPFQKVGSSKETYDPPAYLTILNVNEKGKRNVCHAGEERKSKDAQHSKRSCMHNKANEAAA
jgi:hypothetical protein